MVSQDLEQIIRKSGLILRDHLYTRQETADILRVSRRTLERWEREGRGVEVTRLWEGGRPLYRGKHILAALGD